MLFATIRKFSNASDNYTNIDEKENSVLNELLNLTNLKDNNEN